MHVEGMTEEEGSRCDHDNLHREEVMEKGAVLMSDVEI